MYIVGETLVSDDVFKKKFACQLNACKGACCIQGDAGAPLLESEKEEIKKNWDGIRLHLNAESIKYIEEHNFFEIDADNEPVTKCINNAACVFVNITEGVATCAIEQSFYAGDSDFLKPISCHLYPIRAKKYGEYTALNYHQWSICESACAAGQEGNIAVTDFLKSALIRKFGPAWYAELKEVENALTT